MIDFRDEADCNVLYQLCTGAAITEPLLMLTRQPLLQKRLRRLLGMNFCRKSQGFYGETQDKEILPFIYKFSSWTTWAVRSHNDPEMIEMSMKSKSINWNQNQLKSMSFLGLQSVDAWKPENRASPSVTATYFDALKRDLNKKKWIWIAVWKTISTKDKFKERNRSTMNKQHQAIWTIVRFCDFFEDSRFYKRIKYVHKRRAYKS